MIDDALNIFVEQKVMKPLNAIQALNAFQALQVFQTLFFSN